VAAKEAGHSEPRRQGPDRPDSSQIVVEAAFNLAALAVQQAQSPSRPKEQRGGAGPGWIQCQDASLAEDPFPDLVLGMAFAQILLAQVEDAVGKEVELVADAGAVGAREISQPASRQLAQ